MNPAATPSPDVPPPPGGTPLQDEAAPTETTRPTALPRAAAGGRTGRHRLAVAAVRHLSENAVAVTLDVPDALRDAFAHRPGEHVVVRHRHAGAELRRSYSVCPAPDEPDALRLVIKRGAPDGFGAYAMTGLAPGDVLELSPPTGAFALPERPGAHHVLIAGGSGITPLAAMAVTALREDPECRVSLVHSVPRAVDALLCDELAMVKDAFVDRFTVLYVLTREAQDNGPVDGRIDAANLPRLLAALHAAPGPGTTFALCGPGGLVAAVRQALTDRGADPALIRSELFTLGDSPDPTPPPARPARTSPHGTRVTALYDGRHRVVTAQPQDAALLDSLLRDHPDVPYACREGICGSCRAKVRAGQVTTGPQHALDATELAAGYTLTCRARPLTSEVTLDFDA